MERKENIELNKKELESLILSIDKQVNEHIKLLKHKSSEEILNGSIVEAQKIISQILPIEKEFGKVSESHKSFLELLHNKEESNSSEKEKINSKNNDFDKLDLSEMDFTPHEYYRLPILKSLIYLGGNAKLSDIAGFIEKEMKNKFKKGDHEKGTGGFEKLWVEMVSREKENMIKEALISEDSKSEQWEIIQNGIDYLSHHTA